MNTSLLLEEIKTKLIKENQLVVVQEINEKVSSGSTGSEIWSSVVHYLINLDKENLNAYKFVEKEVKELAAYLTSIGLPTLNG